MPERGEIWLANLNPRRGTEPGKTRPVLILQSQALLDADHPSTLIVPLTTSLVDDAEPLRIRIPASGRLRRNSDLLVDQLRAIDNRRLIQGPMTRLPHALMHRVGEALREVLDLVEE
ncbi:MAG: transcription elongation factor GreAB [candidate division NC10 bacterium RIFCSPLOWO2_12_FULL_66_18]|nr:MAG: transcription elongation factor GreAB [candidate division NC10 bacterium RIFCSPLOWO2_02_FULL_66_22]OGB97780.1 MAG: transcription elongation factor GreAB [candidate division NC10 bacterium RIFCSPLOWO2_12_FULL_66_18]